MRSPSLLVILSLLCPALLVGQAAPAAPPVVEGRVSPLVADVPGVTRGFVHANGARLHYLDFGGSGAPVVLLAGLGNSAWIWSDFAPRLAREGFRVVAITRRAHGESSAPPSGYALDTLAADVVAVMDSLGLRRAHLVGHSFAGGEMTRIAARHPGRVRRLVYVDAAYDRALQRRLDSILPAPQIGTPITDADRASLQAYLAYGRRSRLDLARGWGPAIERDIAASLDADSTGRVRWRHPFAHYGTMIAGASRGAPEYGRVRAPALALYATRTQSLLPADASAALRAQVARFERENHAPWTARSIAQFRSGVRGGRVLKVDGVHHLFLDRPEETLRAIVAFLRP